MRTHREFFQDPVDPMADIVFVGCSVTDAAEPLSPPGGGTAPRRQVILDGRRVKTVDVHAHCWERGHRTCDGEPEQGKRRNQVTRRGKYVLLVLFLFSLSVCLCIS
jgi:hypothetical protein